jgi:hypothetical protein
MPVYLGALWDVTITEALHIGNIELAPRSA